MKLYMFEKPLTLKHNDEQRVYFTSDSHFGHDRDFVYKVRGFNNVSEHDDALFDKINEIVRPNDILFHLGDFCLNTSSSEFEEYLSRLLCQNILYIWGNHNSRVRDVYKHTVEEQFGRTDIDVYPVTYRNITFLGHYKEVVINGQAMVLCHYPFQIWNQQQKQAWCLSGHSHYGNQSTRAENKEGKILDLGWEGHKKPLSFDEVSEIMKKKSYKRVDSHH
jgi:calcineurin-like phosphoesterase family protein